MTDNPSDGIHLDRRSFLAFLGSLSVAPSAPAQLLGGFTQEQLHAAATPLIQVLSIADNINQATSVANMTSRSIVDGKNSRLNIALSLGNQLSASAQQHLAKHPAAQALVDQWMGSFKEEQVELWKQYSGTERLGHYGALCRRHNERRGELLRSIGLSDGDAAKLSEQLREVASNRGLSLNLSALADPEGLSRVINEYVESTCQAPQAIREILQSLRINAQKNTSSADKAQNSKSGESAMSGNDEMTEDEFLRSHMDHPDFVYAVSRNPSHIDRLANECGVAITR